MKAHQLTLVGGVEGVGQVGHRVAERLQRSVEVESDPRDAGSAAIVWSIQSFCGFVGSFRLGVPAGIAFRYDPGADAVIILNYGNINGHKSKISIPTNNRRAGADQ